MVPDSLPTFLTCLLMEAFQKKCVVTRFMSLVFFVTSFVFLVLRSFLFNTKDTKKSTRGTKTKNRKRARGPRS